MLRIRAFRAIDEEKTCEKFAEGHKNVLLEHGIVKVTTSNTEWFYNPDVYVMVIESENGEEVYGGERIHIVNDFAPIPLVDAIKLVDEKIINLVQSYKENRAAELCGLWNSKYLTGRGLGQFLIKIGVSLAMQLEIKNLFALCAPYTVKACQNAGFSIIEEVGDNGSFNYPKLGLVATAVKIEDLKNIEFGDKDFENDILSMYKEPNKIIQHIGESKVFDINLQINFQLK